MTLHQTRIYQYPRSTNYWDQERLVSLIWQHQESQGNGPIVEQLLYEKSGWSRGRFNRVLYLLLSDKKSGVYMVDVDRLAYKW